MKNAKAPPPVPRAAPAARATSADPGKAGKPARAKPAQSKPARTKPAKRKAAKPARRAPPRYAAGETICDEASLTRALAQLAALDPDVVGPMLELAGRPPLRRRAPGLEGLVAIVVSQQVSVASARAIEARVAALLAPLEAATILAADDELLRRCGLSAPKMRTLRAMAQAIASGALDIEGLAHLPPEEAHDRLVAVKGIGPWTADIFLLFCLGHPDAWPAGDLALQEAARLALRLRKRPDAARLQRLGERWRPLRAVAARLLWAYYGAMKARAGIGVA